LTLIASAAQVAWRIDHTPFQSVRVESIVIRSWVGRRPTWSWVMSHTL
jgi:hypothetical protein